MTPGIYALYFHTTDKVYIGQSSCIEERIKRHISSLHKGTHHSAKLSAHYAKDTSIQHIILCKEPNPTTQFILEESYIREFNSYIEGFNCTPGGEVAGSGYSSSNAKFTKEQYEDTYTLLAFTNLSSKDISLATGVSPAVVANISSGRRHQWLQESLDLEFTLIQNRNRCISRDKDKIISALLNIYNNPQMPMTEISCKYSIPLKVVHHIVYGSSYTWLANTNPVEYGKVLRKKP